MWLFLCCLNIVFAQARGEWRPVGPLGMVAAPVELTAHTPSTWVVRGADGSEWRTRSSGRDWDRITDAAVESPEEAWLLEVEARLEDLASAGASPFLPWGPDEEDAVASEEADAAAVAVEASSLLRSELEGDRWFLPDGRPPAAVPAGCGPVTVVGNVRLVVCRSGLHQWFEVEDPSPAGERGVGLQGFIDAALASSEAQQALRGTTFGPGRRVLPQLTATIQARAGAAPGWGLDRWIRRDDGGDWVATVGVSWRPGARSTRAPQPFLLAGTVVLDDEADRPLLVARLRRAMLDDRSRIVERVSRLYGERERLVAAMDHGRGSIQTRASRALRLAEVDAYLDALTGAVMGPRGTPLSMPGEEP